MIPLTLGSILFDETSLEPPEALAAKTSVALAVHDFPGGLRTIQQFGAFPDPIRWRGKISRPDALDRIQAMKSVVAAKQAVTLVYGPFSWVGFIRSFNPVVLHAWRGEYEVEFVPQIDTTLSVDDDGEEADEVQLSDQTSALSGWLSGTPSILPTALFAPVSTLLTATEGALADAGGIVSQIGSVAAAVPVMAAQAVQLAASPLIAMTDATQAYPAADVSARAAIVATLVSGVPSTRWTRQLVNPNLFTLAAQYYGDPGQWQTIAAANNLTDPQPIGSFQLSIPAP